MPDPEETKTDAPDTSGQADTTPDAPSSQPDGQAGEKPDGETKTDDLPEKFKGKSVQEVAKSYLELEKKLGEHSTTVDQAKKQLKQWEALGAVLESNPELYRAVEDEILRVNGKKRDTTENDPASAKDDTRIATENILINNFEKQFGIDQLPPEKRGELHKQIGTELAEMIDPGGEKSVKDVMNSIPLDRLPKYLEKAYRLATINDANEKARLDGLLQARQNNEASFSSVPSSSVNGQKVQLSDEEKKVARRMNISEEDYLKQKIALQNE